MGHRGHKSDPLYRCRRLLTKADDRIGEQGKEKLLGLLRAGDPRGEVATTWHAKEAVRELDTHTDPTLALEWLERLLDDMADTDNPIEVRSLGRTLKRWKHQIVAWHTAHVTKRTYRSREQSDQAGEARRIRLQVFAELPDPIAALRWQA